MMTSSPTSLRSGGLERIARFLADHAGLYFSKQDLHDLQRGVVQTLRSLDIKGIDELMEILERDDDRGRFCFEALARNVTIGETYFFRYPEQFKVIREQVLPQLIAARRKAGDLYLRIWSAGCSTGEEPFSIAMMLADMLEDFEAWNITILATDINRESLDRARAGEYGPWSFRGVDPHVRDAHFSPMPDGKTWVIAPRLKRVVHYDYLNLGDDCYPSLLTQTTAMDLIFCRNVLIYFSNASSERVISRLFESLVEGGHLFVGAVEPNEKSFRPFEAEFKNGTMVYRRPVLPPDAELPLPVPRRAKAKTAKILALPAMTEAEKKSQAALLLAVAAAERGHLEHADAHCQVSLSAQPTNLRAHHLSALIASERGDHLRAIDFYRHCVFLDRSFVLGHFGLAMAYRELGEVPECRRFMQNALNLLEGFADGDVLPGVEEMSVGWVRSIAKAYLRDAPVGASRTKVRE